jgi:hypothetical protein
MRIEDPDSNTVLKRIDVCLEESEAKELRDKLEILLRDSERGEKAHEHVSSTDYKVEMTVWLSPG